MSDLVLSVRAAAAVGRGEPIRLHQVDVSNPIATHGQGFDISPFLKDGVEIDPESVLSGDGLLNRDLMKFVGDELWKRLTPGDIEAALLDRLAGSRVYLDLRSDALHAYPWEVLRCRNLFVFALDQCSWCIGGPHPLAGPFVGDPPNLEHPLRVMVVIGNKPDEPDDKKLRADEELERIERQLHRKNADVLLKALFRPRPDAIEEALQDFKPHVFHFIGHGALVDDEPVIHVWAQDAKTNDPWDAERIESVFGSQPPRLVVLNACLTAADSSQPTRSLAAAFLNAGCISVLAMMGEIRGDASVAFSETFYQHLFDGKPVDQAAARTRLFLKDLAPPAPALRSNWPLTRLLVHGDADSAVRVSHEGADVRRWLSDDFVDRWNHRWNLWRNLILQKSRLALLCGGENSGKSELFRTLAEVWSRSAKRVIIVDVSVGPTGDWLELLKRITDSAEASEGIDAAQLRALVNSGQASEQLIPAYLKALESSAGGQYVLVIIDGLSQWNLPLLEATVLPQICAPFLRQDSTSRVRMMIALRKPPNPAVWGAIPAGWDTIEVGRFSADEWKRAVQQFDWYWRSQIVDEAKRANFARYVEATTGHPDTSAEALSLLRWVAKSLLPRR